MGKSQHDVGQRFTRQLRATNQDSWIFEEKSRLLFRSLT